MIGHIYLIRNLVNGKGYVGQTLVPIAHRFRRHQSDSMHGSNLAIHAAIRKYGIGNFSVSEIASCDAVLLNNLERHYIEFYGTFASVGHGYNLTEGGDGASGYIHSEEAKGKMSNAKKGKTPWLGKHHSEEAKSKMGLSKLGKKQSAEHIARAAAGKRGKKRKPFSAEHRANIALSNTGRVISEQTRTKLSIAGKKALHPKGLKASQETKDKMSAAHKGRKMPPRSEQWKLKQRDAQLKNRSETRNA